MSTFARGRPAAPGAQDPPHGRLADVVAEPGQLAVHPAVSPGRVLPRQPQHQVADLLAGPRAAWPVRVRPLACDQAAVPGQQRARRDEPVGAQRGWQQPGQRRQDRPVGPVRLGPGDLTPEHRDLMTEHHDLRVLGRLAAAQQHQPAEDPDHDQVEQTNSTRTAILPQPAHPAKPQVTVPVASSGAVQARVGAGEGQHRLRLRREVYTAAAAASIKGGLHAVGRFVRMSMRVNLLHAEAGAQIRALDRLATRTEGTYYYALSLGLALFRGKLKKLAVQRTSNTLETLLCLHLKGYFMNLLDAASPISGFPVLDGIHQSHGIRGTFPEDTCACLTT